MSEKMYVLLGISDDTVENETFVYFIGVFETLLLANENLTQLLADRSSGTRTDRGYKRSDYIIKSITVNKTYDYDWSNRDKDGV